MPSRRISVSFGPLGEGGAAPPGGTGPVTWEACNRNVGTSEPQRGNISPYRGPSEAPAGASSPHHSCLTVCDVLIYSLQAVKSARWRAARMGGMSEGAPERGFAQLQLELAQVEGTSGAHWVRPLAAGTTSAPCTGERIGQCSGECS